MTRLRLDLYRADDGWRWRLHAGSRIVAHGGQGYSRRVDCVRACELVTGCGAEEIVYALRTGKSHAFRDGEAAQMELRVLDEREGAGVAK